MEHFTPKYRRDPNELVHSMYVGVGSGHKTITQTIKKSRDGDRMETTRTEAPGLERGQGGQIGVLILGGMETTLDEMEYLVEAQKEKKFVPRKGPKEIIDMCHALTERRNEAIKYFRKNPSEAPKKQTVRLHLPVGYKYVNTSEPGLKILAQV